LALLTATALLAALLATLLTTLASGLLLLLTGLLLAGLLAALLLLLLPALLHITHFVVRHRNSPSRKDSAPRQFPLSPRQFLSGHLRWAAMPERAGTRIKGGR
jgi:predicted lipid-binding transport protein (Tim44 family)